MRYLLLTGLVWVLVLSGWGLTAAEGDCGWVLWWKTRGEKNPGGGRVEPYAAFASLEPCLAAMRQIHSMLRMSADNNPTILTVTPPEPWIVHNKMLITTKTQQETVFHELSCWPTPIKPE